MTRLLFNLDADEALFRNIATGLDADRGAIERRRFPDGESYVRIDSDCGGRKVQIVSGLLRPDERFLTLIFAAATIRELGADRVGLVAPYLPYMRQDKRFRPGEAITSRHFAALISQHFDALITVDPHLHRFASLNEIYSIECSVVPAAPALAHWIMSNVSAPVIVGPDAESEQWVAAVAGLASAPYAICNKVRSGDRDVAVSLTGIELPAGRTPVLVDDIISTGRTMAVTIEHLITAGCSPPVCVGVHAAFDDSAHELLMSAGAAAVVTCNTVTHASNAIDLAPPIIAAIRESCVD